MFFIRFCGFCHFFSRRIFLFEVFVNLCIMFWRNPNWFCPRNWDVETRRAATLYLASIKIPADSTLFEKSNFCPKIQFWQNHNIFTSFSPNFFLTIFLAKSKLSTTTKSKTTTLSRVNHPKNGQFSREIKVEFLDKKWRFRT